MSGNILFRVISKACDLFTFKFLPVTEDKISRDEEDLAYYLGWNLAMHGHRYFCHCQTAVSVVLTSDHLRLFYWYGYRSVKSLTSPDERRWCYEFSN